MMIARKAVKHEKRGAQRKKRVTQKGMDEINILLRILNSNLGLPAPETTLDSEWITQREDRNEEPIRGLDMNRKLSSADWKELEDLQNKLSQQRELYQKWINLSDEEKQETEDPDLLYNDEENRKRWCMHQRNALGKWEEDTKQHIARLKASRQQRDLLQQVITSMDESLASRRAGLDRRRQLLDKKLRELCEPFEPNEIHQLGRLAARNNRVQQSLPRGVMKQVAGFLGHLPNTQT